LLAQQRGRIRLAVEPGLEVESRRQAEIRVRGPRVAVDATVLAAAIRIDRAVERNIGRVVAGDDGARGVDVHGRAQRRHLLLRSAPAVVLGLVAVGLEAPGSVAGRAATLARQGRARRDSGRSVVWRNPGHGATRGEGPSCAMRAGASRRGGGAIAGRERRWNHEGMPPPSEAPTPPRYSLWLMPPAAVYDRFARLIDALSRRFGTPRFAPHITLASTGAELAGDAPARAAALAAELAPVPVRLLDVAHTDDYFRSLFVRAQRTPALLAAHRLAAARLGTEPAEDFMPHLSLLYGELPRDTKERLIEEIGRR